MHLYFYACRPVYRFVPAKRIKPARQQKDDIQLSKTAKASYPSGYRQRMAAPIAKGQL